MVSKDDDPSGLQLADQHQSPIVYNRIKEIQIYQVMELQLDTLDHLVSEENRSLGFTSLSAGVLISSAVSFLTASTLSPRAYGVYVAVLIVSFVGTAWFGIVWRVACKKRPKLLAQIKENTIRMNQ